MKLFVLSSLAGAGLIVTAAFAPPTLLERQASLLQDAKSLKVTYSLRVNGVANDFTLTYSKPNLMIIDGPNKMIEADGSNLTEYDKTAKTYTQTAETPELLFKKAQSDEVMGWAAFFIENYMKNVSNVQPGESRNIKGNAVTGVTFNYGTVEPVAVTMYVDDKLGVARGFSFKGKSGDVLAVASKIETGSDPIGADKFAFVAPAGATKVEAPVAGAGWSTVQPIFAANCSPCHNGRGKGGFSIDSYAAVMKGARGNPVITAGDPDNSELIKLITGQAQPKMPPSGDVSGDDVQKLKDWIKAGAKE